MVVKLKMSSDSHQVRRKGRGEGEVFSANDPHIERQEKESLLSLSEKILILISFELFLFSKHSLPYLTK